MVRAATRYRYVVVVLVDLSVSRTTIEARIVRDELPPLDGLGFILRSHPFSSTPPMLSRVSSNCLLMSLLPLLEVDHILRMSFTPLTARITDIARMSIAPATQIIAVGSVPLGRLLGMKLTTPSVDSIAILGPASSCILYGLLLTR